MKVCILLAAYNGAAYIRQQIDSILQQDYPNIQLVLSDDGSQDGTQEILAEYEAKYPGRVIWHQSGKRFGKAQTHFMHLLRTFHDADYIMFSDQDDVWHPDTDAAIALTTAELLLQSRGIGTCWAGYLRTFMNAVPELQAYVRLPENCTFCGCLLAGYPTEEYHYIPERVVRPEIREIK